MRGVWIWVVLGWSTVANAGIFFTPAERAFLFHVVDKNEVLRNSLSPFFNYSGDSVYLTGDYQNVLDYDSISTMIIMEPSILQVDFEGMKRAPQSILAEASSKLALWKLVNVLESPAADANRSDYRAFMKVVHEKMPDAAFKNKDRISLRKQVKELINPDLSLLDKREIIHEIDDIRLEDKRDILEALDMAYKAYTYKLTLRYFDMIGGQAARFENILLAAGEGSKTYGMMEEFDKDEHGRTKVSEPRGIGLFTYQYSIRKMDSGERNIFVKADPIVEYQEFHDPKNTSLHLSLWGFNAFFQTTVVLKSGNKSYLLYASRDRQLLTADSAYSHGKTYHDHIADIEKRVIPGLREQLYGKDGYHASKAHWKDRKTFYYDRIRETELELRQYQGVNKKKYKRAQDKYIQANNQYSNAKSRYKKVNRVIFDKEQRLEYLEDQLYYMKSNLGFTPQGYELQDSLFVFEDGSTFNPFTQDFHFNSIARGEFSVRLISIGSKPHSKAVDEVQLLVNVLKRPEPSQVNVDIEIADSFDPDAFHSNAIAFEGVDKNALNALIDHIVEEKKLGVAVLRGGGIGRRTDDGTLVEHKEAEELQSYPGLTKRDQEKNRMKPEFKDLRATKVALFIDGTFNIQIASFTDPVVSRIADKDTAVARLMSETNINSGNDILSALRTMETFEHLINLLQSTLAERDDLSVAQMSKVSEILTQTRDNAIVLVGTRRFGYLRFKTL